MTYLGFIVFSFNLVGSRIHGTLKRSQVLIREVDSRVAPGLGREHRREGRRSPLSSLCEGVVLGRHLELKLMAFMDTLHCVKSRFDKPFNVC